MIETGKKLSVEPIYDRHTIHEAKESTLPDLNAPLVHPVLNGHHNTNFQFKLEKSSRGNSCEMMSWMVPVDRRPRQQHQLPGCCCLHSG